MKNRLPYRRSFFAKLFCLFLLILIQIFSSNSFAQSQLQVKGKVVDELNEPLIGVNIIIKGSKTGTVTDFNGNFSLTVDDAAILRLSYIGYNELELSYAEANAKTIKMTEASKLMSEVVVVGYGTQRKIDVSGAVTSVSADVTKDRVIQNIGDALKGKVSGVVVSAMNGEPGSANSISIRGNTSLSGSSEPLYVIDGVISEASDVVPSQIATIDILKDASSTAIYGSRGANGVVTITTNQGSKNTKTKVDFYGVYGYQQLTKFLPMLNAEQLGDYKYLSNVNSVGANYDLSLNGQTFGDVETGPILLTDNEGRFWSIARNAFFNANYYRNDPLKANTDWQKEVYRIAPTQDYRITISGGENKSSYSLMLGKKKQDGIQIASGTENYNFRLNIRQAINDKMNIGVTSSIQHTTTDPSKVNNVLSITSFLNRDELSRLMPGEEDVPATIQNPLYYTKLITNTNKELVSNHTGVFDWKILNNLVFNTTSSYITRKFSNDKFYPSNFANGRSYNGIATMTARDITELRSENTLQYNTKINKSNFGAMLGNSFATRKTETTITENKNFTLQDLGVEGISEGLSPSKPNYDYIASNNLSYFGRANYTYADKYILKASLRADGSSVFAKNNKWGYFPSMGVAWRVNEEKFLKSVSDLSNFKIRLSYGKSGKQSINPYQSLPTSLLTRVTTDGVSNTSSLIFNRIGNDNLKWETTREIDFGFDLGLFKERINIVFDLYDKETYDLLYEDPLPAYMGYNSQMKNVGKVLNRGVEFNMNAGVIKNYYGFNWDINFNISKNISKILSLGQQDFKYVSTGWSKPDAVQGILKVGDPLGNWYGYKTNGLWQSYAEIDAARANGTLASGITCHPGYIKYMDISGPNGVPDGKITADDRQVLGNGFPNFTGGLSNTWSYKGLSLSMTLQFSVGQDVFNASAWGIDGVSPSGSTYSYSKNVLQSFRPTLYYYDAVTGKKGDLFIEGVASNRYPTQMAQRINNTEDIPLDLYIEDASFLRIADITFSYSFNKTFLSKLKVTNLKLFLTGTNLYVFTNYTGYDPEVNSSNGQASFLMPGLDSQAYPKSRIVSAGINLTF